MSANRDRNQRVAFVYSNLYEIYRKSPKDQLSPGQTSAVIKTGDRRVVEPYSPAQLIAKLPEPMVQKAAAPSSEGDYQSSTLQSLKDNLQDLNELHARLRFMLKELEDLVKED